MGKVFKRLFVFLMLFVVCPAVQAAGSDTCNDNNGSCGTIGTESSASCNNPPLLYHSQSYNYGTYTLTAQYTQDNYTVWYKAGTCLSRDGDLSFSGNHYEDTYSVYNLPDSTNLPGFSVPSSTTGDYVFDGWRACWVDCDSASSFNDSSNCPSTLYKPGTASASITWNQEKCLVLFGQCSYVAPDTYTVTYKVGTCGNNPETIIDTDTGTANTAYNISTNASNWAASPMPKTGYRFVEWRKNGVVWTGESSLTESITVYAECVKKDYTVTYVNEDCSADTGFNSYQGTDGRIQESYGPILDIGSGGVSGISIPSVSGTNYVFDGWKPCWVDCGDSNDTGTCENNSWAPGYSFTWTQDKCLQLRAKCSERTCTDGQYFNGTSCTPCPTGYGHSEQNATSVTQCYKIEIANTCTQNTNPNINTANLEHCEYELNCNCTPEQYRVYSNANGDGDGKMTDINGETEYTTVPAPSCMLNFVSVPTGESGYTYNPQTGRCEQNTFECPQAYPLSINAQVTSYTECYKIVDVTGCEQIGAGPEIVDHCIYQKSCECTNSVTYRQYSNESGNGDGIKTDINGTTITEIPLRICQAERGNTPTGAETGYEYNSLTGKCEQIPTYPVTYDCKNNGLGINGNGTNPQDTNSPYAAGTSVTLLDYPAACQNPAERVTDAELGWKCVDANGNTVFEGATGDFTMPNSAVTCEAQWKSTAWSITYIGCDCSGNPKANGYYEDLYNNKCKEILTHLVRSGEDENNDVSTYYRTYTENRSVDFPVVTGSTNYGEIDVAPEAFGAGTRNWFFFKFRKLNGMDVPYGTTSSTSTESSGENTNLRIYRCLDGYYKLTYDCKDDTPANDPVDETYADNTLVTVNKGNMLVNGQKQCYKPGHTFVWKCTPEDSTMPSGGIINPSSSNNKFRIHHNTNCEAQWTEIKHKLTFDCNNNKDSLDVRQNLSIGATVNMDTAPTCQQKTGHKVDYTWSCTASPVSGVITIPDADVTCTAQWTPERYDVIYKSGNCTDSPETVVYTDGYDVRTGRGGATYGQNYTVPSNANNAITVKQGYTFANAWNTVSGQPSGNFPGNSERPWSHTSSVTVYAVCNPIQYTLTLRCNDGETVDRVTTYNAGESVSLVSDSRNGCADNTPAKTFTNWTCSPSNLYDDSSVTMNNNVVCDAHWNEKYHLTYDCNNDGKNPNPSDSWHSENDPVMTLTDDQQDTCVTPPVAGMEFVGWNCPNTNRNAETGAMTMPNHDVTCTAQWDGAEFRVTYDCNGTTVTGGHVKNKEDVTEVHSGIKYGSDSFEFKTVKQICEFDHHEPESWVCVRTDTNSDITRTINFGASEKWNRPYDVLCTTDWTPEQYTLTYDCNNDGKGTDNKGTNPQGGTYDYGTEVNMVEEDGGCKLPSTGKTFQGWTCVGATPVNGVITMINDVTCTAQWDDAVYYLTYDCGAGYGVPPKDEDEEGNQIPHIWTDPVTMKNNTCEKEEASFAYWRCDGTTDVAQGRTFYMPQHDVVCVAQWNQRYKLIYNCANSNENQSALSGGNNYTGDGTEKVLLWTQSGTKVGLCDIPDGKEFDGWTCDNAVPSGGYITMPRNDVVCTANWKNGTMWSITYIGCKSGNCPDCSDPWVLNAYVNPDKQVYSPTTSPAIYFPVPDKNEDILLSETLETAGYYFSGVWWNQYGSRRTNTGPLWGDLTLCTNLKPYYDVTYACGWDGVSAPIDENNSYVSGENVTVKAGSECGDGVRPGYTFTKWSCQPDGKSAFEIDAGKKFEIEADTTCTAQWIKDPYSVTYNCNGQTNKTSNMVDSPIYYGDDYDFADVDTKCLHDGYTFGGWECKKVKAGSLLGVYRCPASNDPAMASACPDSITWGFEDSLNCKALWNVNTYTVTYDKGVCGDTAGEIRTDTATYGVKYTASEAAYALMTNAIKTGYTFVGWNTESGKTESNWNGENPWARNTNLTVYAACTPNTYDVIYDKNNCESKTGTDYVHENGATYNENYYKLNGGSPDSTTGIYAGTGYTFRGWSVTDALTDEDFNMDGTLKNPWTGVTPWLFTEAQRVYGICTPNPYYVIYMKGNCEAKENTDGTFTDGAVYNTNYTVLGLDAEGMNITTKPGYEFKGWKISYAALNPDYYAGDVFEPWTRTSDLYLYAQCEQKPYHVEYNCDTNTACNESDDTGCRTPKDDSDYYINDSVAVPVQGANTCVKPGWTFNEWNCAARNENETQLPITTINASNKRFTMIDADALCTADWNEDHYYVTYDCNGGVNAPVDPEGYTYDSDVETYGTNNPDKLNTCERTGYEFNFWVCGEGEEARDIPQGGIFRGIRHDITCHAQWIPNTYDIIYESGTCGGKIENGGYYSVSKMFDDALTYDAEYEVKDIIDVPNLLAQGYEFLGWSRENGGTTEADVDSAYAPGEGHGPWMEANDLTLHAVCKKKVYNICYDFQVDGGGWKDTNAAPLYAFMIDTEDADVLLGVHNDGNVDSGTFYVFDGWYNSKTGEGEKVQKVLRDSILLETPVSIQCSDKISSEQCNNGEDYASCDVMLYAKWRSAGKVKFDCLTGYTQAEKKSVGQSVKAKEPKVCDDYIGECRFVTWHCDNYTGNPKDFEQGSPIEVLLPNTTVVCTPVIDCSEVERHITYKVYDAETGVSIDSVVANGDFVEVVDLEPDTYTTAEAVYYPEISLPDCIFVGDTWYEDEGFTKPTQHTPVAGEDIAVEEAPDDITVYGKMLCGGANIIYHNVPENATYPDGTNPDTYTVVSDFDLNAPSRQYYRFKGWHYDSENGKLVSHINGADYRGDIHLYAEWEFECNEAGHEHWFHIGNNPNDKVCLYEERPQTEGLPFVRVKGKKNAEPYYMMLSSDPDMIIHEGSEKSMRIQHSDGNIYNVCDRSSCPDL